MMMRRMPPFAADWAFFLDIDGTLLEFAARPQDVRVGTELLGLLERLRAATGGALALVSGRPVKDIDKLFAPLKLPAAGLHGTERRSANGSMRRHAPPLDNLGRGAAAIVRLTAEHCGLVFENKGMALALHYRQAPALRTLAEREAALEMARKVAESHLAKARTGLGAEVERAKVELNVTCQTLANQIADSLVGNGTGPDSGRIN